MSNMEERVRNYYENFFSHLPQNTLFELYDIVNERFTAFPGREASSVITRNRLINNLTEMEILNKKLVESLVVIVYDEEEIAFTDPVFIGAKDCFKG